MLTWRRKTFKEVLYQLGSLPLPARPRSRRLLPESARQQVRQIIKRIGTVCINGKSTVGRMNQFKILPAESGPVCRHYREQKKPNMIKVELVHVKSTYPEG